jgi:uncharacterized protein (DUF433 family)
MKPTPQSGTRLSPQQVMACDDDILGGTPVFSGTRVPLATLFAYLASGDTLDEFLEDFPGVSRDQAVSLLHVAKEQIIEYARHEHTVHRHSQAQAL